LRIQHKAVVVLELKHPTENLDDKLWAGQVLTYCRDIDAPFGLLFNGHSLRVYINTFVKQLSRHQARFREEPVASAEYSDVEQMANLLSKFSLAALQTSPIALANRLANAENRVRAGKERQNAIHGILMKCLAVSPPGDIDEILSALSTLNSLWTAVEPNPTKAELVTAWEARSAILRPQQRTGALKGANPTLRAKIAEVCASRGWDVVEQANIRGLNCHLDGVEDHGFQRVPQGPGVPAGLCVQGKDTAGAKRIVAELEKLLTVRSA
jgi:hypothetical protein